MIAKIDILPDGRTVLMPDDDLTYYITRQDCKVADVFLRDGRHISADQRKKIFATIRDISLWCGHDPEYLRGMFTWDFCGMFDYDVFSLSAYRNNAATVTIAREFTTYLLDFCLSNGVPLKEPISGRADDISAAMYLCLKHRKCAACGRPADVHHIDAIGMGSDRKSVSHIGRQAVALCRKHHEESHTAGWRDFSELHHICGVRLDKYLCDKLNLNAKGADDGTSN